MIKYQSFRKNGPENVIECLEAKRLYVHNFDVSRKVKRCFHSGLMAAPKVIRSLVIIKCLFSPYVVVDKRTAKASRLANKRVRRRRFFLPFVTYFL